MKPRKDEDYTALCQIERSMRNELSTIMGSNNRLLNYLNSMKSSTKPIGINGVLKALSMLRASDLKVQEPCSAEMVEGWMHALSEASRRPLRALLFKNIVFDEPVYPEFRRECALNDALDELESHNSWSIVLSGAALCALLVALFVLLFHMNFYVSLLLFSLIYLGLLAYCFLWLLPRMEVRQLKRLTTGMTPNVCSFVRSISLANYGPVPDRYAMAKIMKTLTHMAAHKLHLDKRQKPQKERKVRSLRPRRRSVQPAFALAMAGAMGSGDSAGTASIRHSGDQDYQPGDTREMLPFSSSSLAFAASPAAATMAAVDMASHSASGPAAHPRSRLDGDRSLSSLSAGSAKRSRSRQTAQKKEPAVSRTSNGMIAGYFDEDPGLKRPAQANESAGAASAATAESVSTVSSSSAAHPVAEPSSGPSASQACSKKKPVQKRRGRTSLKSPWVRGQGESSAFSGTPALPATPATPKRASSAKPASSPSAFASSRPALSRSATLASSRRASEPSVLAAHEPAGSKKSTLSRTALAASKAAAASQAAAAAASRSASASSPSASSSSLARSSRPRRRAAPDRKKQAAASTWKTSGDPEGPNPHQTHYVMELEETTFYTRDANSRARSSSQGIPLSQ